ncbi:LysR family transcriptional regulator [Dyella solisilvae]|uniref:LysR family transcriptional regulator n=1 Tax=Dyella solisilvae TaxID=1920168 RepID=A0A370KD04_9GAMM|nr:LysR family transcriptional regulator [Dyella solisilvae]RDJ00534.1 LysR family transcriptional regulator [Dyella solisilvae]
MIDFEDMRLFVRAVTDGSLSAAGRELSLSPAAASKRLTRLEQALGVRLLQRSSRRLALTAEGSIYFERCLAILADVDDANAAVGQGQQEVRGQLHVSASVDMGRQYIGPIAADFVAPYPRLTLRLTHTDAMLDLFEQGVDVAVRGGAMTDSRLVSRLLTNNFRVLCAAPSYLERRGRPLSVDDLSAHDCLMLHRPGHGILPWIVQTPEGPRPLRMEGSITCDNGDLMRALAVAGHGLAFKSAWDIAEDVRAGRLVPLSGEVIMPDAHIYAIYPSRRYLPARIRLFVDHLQQELQRREHDVLDTVRHAMT